MMTIGQLRTLLARYNDWEEVCIAVNNIPDDEDADGFIYTNPEIVFAEPEVEPMLKSDGKSCIALMCDYEDLR